MTDAVQAVARALRERMLPWYAANRRDLPWRHTHDAYALVVAELMLQQTGVDRVAPRWSAFVRRFPGWSDLASAPLGDVIREWRGLGYNRRAVALHRMAGEVVSRHGGELPSDLAALRRLPGIGPYTANAILSFVHGYDVPAMDVNLRRVIGRLAFGDALAPLEQTELVAREGLPSGRSADWNQALMDFAAVQCTLRRPACLICPLRDVCQYAGPGSVDVDIPKPSVPVDRPAPYHGSTRYQRGKVVDMLREADALTAPGIARSLGEDPLAGQPDVATILAGLVRDGLLREHAGRYSLP